MGSETDVSVKHLRSSVSPVQGGLFLLSRVLTSYFQGHVLPVLEPLVLTLACLLRIPEASGAGEVGRFMGQGTIPVDVSGSTFTHLR